MFVNECSVCFSRDDLDLDKEWIYDVNILLVQQCLWI